MSSYAGRHIAVFDAEVVADGDDPAEVRATAARKNNVDPERIAVLYVDSPAETDQPLE